MKKIILILYTIIVTSAIAKETDNIKYVSHYKIGKNKYIPAIEASAIVNLPNNTVFLYIVKNIQSKNFYGYVVSEGTKYGLYPERKITTNPKKMKIVWLKKNKKTKATKKSTPKIIEIAKQLIDQINKNEKKLVEKAKKGSGLPAYM